MRQTGSSPLVRVLVAGIAWALVACGGTPPPPERGVLERDVSSWTFRRYQALLDVEVWVESNKGVAYTASYARGEAEKAGRLDEGDVVNAFVTRYERDEGVLRALVVFARRLVKDAGYTVEEHRQGGVRLFQVRGPTEAWVLWAADRHVIKIGGRGVREVPTTLVEAYGKRYPSRLRSGMLEGPLPPASGKDERDPDGEPYDPDNPTPEWDRYRPGDTDLPTIDKE